MVNVLLYVLKKRDLLKYWKSVWYYYRLTITLVKVEYREQILQDNCFENTLLTIKQKISNSLKIVNPGKHYVRLEWETWYSFDKYLD